MRHRSYSNNRLSVKKAKKQPEKPKEVENNEITVQEEKAILDEFNSALKEGGHDGHQRLGLLLRLTKKIRKDKKIGFGIMDRLAEQLQKQTDEVETFNEML